VTVACVTAAPRFLLMVVETDEPLKEVHAQKASHDPQHGEVRPGHPICPVIVTVVAVVVAVTGSFGHALDCMRQQIERSDPSHDTGDKAKQNLHPSMRDSETQRDNTAEKRRGCRDRTRNEDDLGWHWSEL
jgi:hypothetical protein